MEIGLKERLKLFFQRFVGWATFAGWGAFIFLLLRFVARYRIKNMGEMRRRYRELSKRAGGPVLICANHLTKIDTALIVWGLASIGSYVRSFKLLPWSLPERTRYAGSLVLRAVCYLGSCVPVSRGGDRDAANLALAKVAYLLRKGYRAMIFPEGKRGRSGVIEVEEGSYGAGRLMEAVEDCRVLCVYMRGENQKSWGSIPRVGEKFYMDMRLIVPRSVHTGLRAARDISRAILAELKAMEEAYFALSR